MQRSICTAIQRDGTLTRGPRRRLALAWALAMGLAMVRVSAGCSTSDAVAPLPARAISDVPLTLQRRFPSASHPGPRSRACTFASPLAVDAGGGRRIVLADGDGAITAVDPATGAVSWSVPLPAPQGEVPFIVATPVVVDRNVVVAYHTVPADAAARTVSTLRLRHRVAVVNLDAQALDPAFPYVELSATLPGRFGEIAFVPSHAMARGALIHAVSPGARAGRVYVTLGNPRDQQPYHGWLFELDLDAWQASAGSQAVAAVRTTTEDTDCGEEGGDGAVDTRCGGGVWAPSGPLLVEREGGYELLVPTGNGQLDLARGSYANTLLRVGPGLTFTTPGCSASECAGFRSDTLDEACLATCRDLFVPRPLPGEQPPRPATGVCEGKSVYACWAIQDHLDGGSTPVALTLPSGRRVLVYPTKDGHLWLVDAEHMGRVYAHHAITDGCGASDDPCSMGWAGTIVTKPLVTQIDGALAVLVPSFMPDRTHPAGVVAVKVLEDGSTPRLETVWQFPPFDDPSARQRFRRHPSRATAATPASGEEHAFVVDVAAPGKRGKLLAIRTRDGKLASEVDLVGPGYRFAAPLFEGGTVYVTSCDDDASGGTLEAYDVLPAGAR